MMKAVKEQKMPSMVSETKAPLDLAASLHNINVDLLVTSAFLRSIPLLSEVVLDTMPQSIIAILARRAGADVTYLINQALCEQHGLAFFRASIAAGVQPYCLGNESKDVVIAPKVQAGFEGLSELAESIKVRTPDAYLTGRSRVNWLALSEVTADILNETTAFAREQQPLISGFVTNEQVVDIITWCDCHNYVAVDNVLEPLNANSANVYSWLVPNQTMLNKVTEWVGKDKAAVNTKLPLPMLAEQTWPTLTTNNDALAKQTADFLLHKRRWYYLDRLLNLGLHPVETDGENYWRWIGGNGTRLFLPLRARGHYSLYFTVFSLVADLEKSIIRCFVNGRMKKCVEVRAGQSVIIPHYADKDGGIAELLIVSENSRQVDGKELSISLSELVVNWNEEPV